MSDRSLLEDAAKAAGIDAEFHPELGFGPEGMWLKGARSPDNSKYWNPLENDGDALRLAVKLSIDVQQFIGSGMVEAWKHPHQAHGEDYGADPYAATRRAITRAAAAISSQNRGVV